ncbi:MAG: hypothetical protein ABI633_07890, partial [Burkholderiales bacterium]
QKRVWCPKWTPASSISRMLTVIEVPKVGSKIRHELQLDVQVATPFECRVCDLSIRPPFKPNLIRSAAIPLRELLATLASG